MLFRCPGANNGDGEFIEDILGIDSSVAIKVSVALIVLSLLLGFTRVVLHGEMLYWTTVYQISIPSYSNNNSVIAD